jgi:hypothetical protein
MAKVHPQGASSSTNTFAAAEVEPDMAAAMAAEQVVIDRLVEEMHTGGYGWVEGRKPSDVLRLMGENVNSLSLFDDERAWKVPKLKEINKRYQTDGLIMQETGTNFPLLGSEQALDVLLGDNDC